jgi:Tfp pilus assembly protein, tip-associated adhesin PilY1
MKNNHRRTGPQQHWHRACLALLALHLGLSNTAWAAIDIPPVPLQSGTVAPPNILFILDDSTSMADDYMPDKLSNVEYLRKNHTTNTIYYNPRITYKPWTKADGTPMTGGTSYYAAYTSSQLASGSTTDLSKSDQVYYAPKTKSAQPVSSGNYSDYYRFRIYKNKSDMLIERCEYNKVTSGTPKWDKNCGNESSVSFDNGEITRTVDEELTNFATWYSYHRTRMKVAKAAAGNAFFSLGENYRVGYTTIGHTYKTAGKTPIKYRIPVQNATENDQDQDLFRGSNKEAWFNYIYEEDASGYTRYTPLRAALQGAGEYFKETGADGPWGPETGNNQVACRQNFAILTTDGYWNDDQYWTSRFTSGSVGNADGTSEPGHYTAARPYMDDHSGTLADVAMYYWKKDLRPDLSDIVPTTNTNPANWQHMVTFGISIGLKGTLDPSTDLPALAAGSKSWPNPLANNAGAARIDDLWHATVNGRGRFVAASDPQQLNEGLRQALGSIAEQVSSASNVSANSTQLDTGTMVYQASYMSGSWTGELKAYAISGQGINATPRWLASEQIPAPASRRIYTRSNVDGTGIEFKWNSLTETQRTALESNDLVEYIRGDRSKELSQVNGRFRTRVSVLGDIINSSPAYSADSNTLFVGANDGMLHAFNATTGAERFAYIPSSLLGGLKTLSEQPYEHRYFVDGEIAVSSKAQTPDKNYLVGALGRGGKGVFGLDVTSPGSFSGTNVLWELGANDDDMGLVTGKILIAQTNDDKWVAIFGNGYNSKNERAVLYIVDLATGNATKIDTKAGSQAASNGLSSPAVLDANGDGKVDYVYAGDLLGNLWKFDLSSDSRDAWKVAFGSVDTPAPLFVAKDASGATQPITGQPAAVINNVIGDPNRGKRFVLFGTGRYIAAGDPTNYQVQTWYGVIDSDAQVTRAELKERTIVEQGTVSDMTVRAFSTATSNDMVGKQGWFVDLKVGDNAEGERIVSASRILNLGRPVLIASSIIPETSTCSVAGRGFVNAINPFTGTALDDIFFDINGDGAFNSSDMLNGKIIGSVDLGVGMPTESIVVGNRLAVGGSKGQMNSVGINISAAGRISWREIIKR